MTTHATERKGPKTVAREAESDLEKVTAIVGKYGGNRDSLISILQDIQSEWRYLPEDAVRAVASQLGMQLIQVYSVATFSGHSV